jgi:anti-sigma factor RsiW
LTLSRHLDGDLPSGEGLAIERHLGECVMCRRLLASLSRTIRALGAMGDERATRRADGVIAALRRANTDIHLVNERQGHGGPWRPRLRSAIAYCLQRSQLRFTLPIALLVGTVLSLVNQGGMLLAGEIDVGMCAICALNFLLPFVALNVVRVTAARVASRRS